MTRNMTAVFEALGVLDAALVIAVLLMLGCAAFVFTKNRDKLKGS